MAAVPVILVKPKCGTITTTTATTKNGVFKRDGLKSSSWTFFARRVGEIAPCSYDLSVETDSTGNTLRLSSLFTGIRTINAWPTTRLAKITRKHPFTTGSAGLLSTFFLISAQITCTAGQFSVHFSTINI